MAEKIRFLDCLRALLKRPPAFSRDYRAMQDVAFVERARELEKVVQEAAGFNRKDTKE
jgi:hypothetical protein